MDQELDILQHYKVISSKLKKLAWLLFTVMGAMLKLWARLFTELLRLAALHTELAALEKVA